MNQLKIGALTAAVLLVGVVAAGGVASTQARERPRENPAVTAFWDAFAGHSVEGMLAARERLIAAAEADPNDGELSHLTGASYFFSVAEIGWAEPSIDPSEILSHLEFAYDYTQLAVHTGAQAGIPESDKRSFLKWVGFFGPANYRLGTVLGDEAMMQKGRDINEAIIPGVPDYAYPSLASTFLNTLPDSADFAAAHEAYFLALEHCTGETFDREYPDLTPVLSIVSTTGNPSCGNSPHVPHGLQGALFVFADMLVKNGQPDAARPVYELIPQSDGYDTWASKYHDLLDERLTSDLHARAALYESDDVSLHPQPGLDCLGCHGG